MFVILLANALTNPNLNQLYQTQWWSKRDTHILQIEQCFERAGFTRRQVLHLFFYL